MLSYLVSFVKSDFFRACVNVQTGQLITQIEVCCHVFSPWAPPLALMSCESQALSLSFFKLASGTCQALVFEQSFSEHRGLAQYQEGPRIPSNVVSNKTNKKKNKWPCSTCDGSLSTVTLAESSGEGERG